MIAVLASDTTFSYEIHSLVKAFYPRDDVKVFSARPDTLKDADVMELPPLPKERDPLKRELYLFLSERTKKTLPWGTLTGIRPTRIALSGLYAGKTEEEIRAQFRSEYFTSDEKIALATAIAKREKTILDTIDVRRGYSLYIGIPFCPTTCAYCSFASYPLAKYASLTDDYVTALIKELDYVAKAFRDRELHSIYLGGGTPTTLTPAQSKRLLTAIEDRLDLTHLREFTVECGRPDSMDAEKLKTLKQYGVTRICVNPQTFKQETLNTIGRAHTVEETVSAFCLARDVGFTHINMDLILGLPGETVEDVRHTMEEVVKLNPDDVTVHSLAVKRGSFLHRKLTEGEDFQRADAPFEMMKIATEYAASIGCTPYYLYRQKNMTGNMENTGFAKEGREGIYNILINEEVESIVALGAGAISKRIFYIEETDTYGENTPFSVRIERSENLKELSLYLADIDGMIARKKALFEA